MNKRKLMKRKVSKRSNFLLKKEPPKKVTKFHLILCISVFVAFTITLIIILHAVGAFDKFASKTVPVKPMNSTGKITINSITYTTTNYAAITDKLTRAISLSLSSKISIATPTQFKSIFDFVKWRIKLYIDDVIVRIWFDQKFDSCNVRLQVMK